MRNRTLLLVLAPLVLVIVPGLNGCEEGAEMGTAPTQAAAPAPVETTPAAAQPSSGNGVQSRQSSLGAAKRQAKNVVGEVEQRQNEISKQIDRDLGNDGP